jgi:histidinol-phosphate phosphatase family protein
MGGASNFFPWFQTSPLLSLYGAFARIKEEIAMTKAEGRAVFLDRDGTIILDQGYAKEAQQVRLLAGAGEALAKIKAQGFALVLVSNQSGIGRGLITHAEAEQVHQAVVTRLAEHGVRLDAVFYCPHSPTDECRCRKPSPEMFLRAARELKLDLAESFMVGDKPSDVEAGRRAGCRTILLTADPAANECRPEKVAGDWTQVLRYVLGEPRMIA